VAEAFNIKPEIVGGYLQQCRDPAPGVDFAIR
jgi:hypothetical protein